MPTSDTSSVDSAAPPPRRRWARIIPVVSGALALIGLSGIPGDLVTWASWLAYLDSESVRWVMAIVGFAGVMYYLLKRLDDAEARPMAGVRGDRRSAPPSPRRATPSGRWSLWGTGMSAIPLVMRTGTRRRLSTLAEEIDRRNEDLDRVASNLRRRGELIRLRIENHPTSGDWPSIDADLKSWLHDVREAGFDLSSIPENMAPGADIRFPEYIRVVSDCIDRTNMLPDAAVSGDGPPETE